MLNKLIAVLIIIILISTMIRMTNVWQGWAHHVVKVKVVDAFGEDLPPVKNHRLQDTLGGGLDAGGHQAEQHVLCQVAQEKGNVLQECRSEHEPLHHTAGSGRCRQSSRETGRDGNIAPREEMRRFSCN